MTRDPKTEHVVIKRLSKYKKLRKKPSHHHHLSVEDLSHEKKVYEKKFDLRDFKY